MGLDADRRNERIGLIDHIAAEHGWVRPAEGIVILPGTEAALLNPGSLVFDIDGVLIDTRFSFREVIPRAVNFYMESVLGRDGGGMWMKAEDGDSFKRSGGFNNDWDVSEAGLILALWRSRRLESAPSVQSFTSQISSQGGGLGAARLVLERGAGTEEAGEVLNDIDRPLLERIFKEFYVGGSRYRDIFEEEPVHFHGPGGMEEELPLVDASFLEAAGRRPVGILTGRIPQETLLALETLGLSAETAPDCIVTDDGSFPAKPDPSGLAYIAGELAERPLLYFGDNRDDLTTLLEARRRLRDRRLHFVYCLSGAADLDSVEWFAASGAEMMIVELSEIMTVMVP